MQRVRQVLRDTLALGEAHACARRQRRKPQDEEGHRRERPPDNRRNGGAKRTEHPPQRHEDLVPAGHASGPGDGGGGHGGEPAGRGHVGAGGRRGDRSSGRREAPGSKLLAAIRPRLLLPPGARAGGLTHAGLVLGAAGRRPGGTATTAFDDRQKPDKHQLLSCPDLTSSPPKSSLRASQCLKRIRRK